ncbi:hypothetical protein Efla_003796 [Eimeria flavescens]
MAALLQRLLLSEQQAHRARCLCCSFAAAAAAAAAAARAAAPGAASQSMAAKAAAGIAAAAAARAAAAHAAANASATRLGAARLHAAAAGASDALRCLSRKAHWQQQQQQRHRSSSAAAAAAAVMSDFAAAAAEEEEEKEMLDLFCVCAPGLEAVLGRELQMLLLPPEPHLAAASAAAAAGDTAAATAAAAAAEAAAAASSVLSVELQQGGVALKGPRELLWNLSLRSRIAEEIRVAVGQPFTARSHDAGRAVRCVELPRRERFVAFSAAFDEPQVSVASHASRLYSRSLVASLVLEGLKERRRQLLQGGLPDELPSSMQARGVGAAGPPKIHVVIRHNVCTVRVAASGPLTPRVWRVRQGNAPLRETLAAAAVYLSSIFCLLRQHKRLTVIDPLCGSGTLLLELLSLAAGLPPHSPRRSLPFTKFPGHSKSRFDAFLACLPLSPHPNIDGLRLVGGDISEAQIEAARLNAEAFLLRSPRRTDGGKELEEGRPAATAAAAARRRAFSWTGADFTSKARSQPALCCGRQLGICCFCFFTVAREAALQSSSL